MHWRHELRLLSWKESYPRVSRTRALNHRLFKKICQETISEHEVLLYYTEVRWLSRGQVLKRLFELRVEDSIFLKKKESALYKILETENILQGLAYLSDIFSYLNDINMSLHSPAVTIVDATKWLKAFLCKLSLWNRRVNASVTANFFMLEELLSHSETQSVRSLSKEVQKEASEHHYMHLALTKTIPQFNVLIERKQQQPSN